VDDSQANSADGFWEESGAICRDGTFRSARLDLGSLGRQIPGNAMKITKVAVVSLSTPGVHTGDAMGFDVYGQPGYLLYALNTGDIGYCLHEFVGSKVNHV
jgi:hypothetical protein